MNVILGHRFALIGETGPGKSPDDGEMNQMTLPSRHRIPSGVRPSTLPLGHGGSQQHWIFTSARWRNIFFLWNLKAGVGFEPAISDFPSRQLSSLHQSSARIVVTNYSDRYIMIEWLRPYKTKSNITVAHKLKLSTFTRKVYNYVLVVLVR